VEAAHAADEGERDEPPGERAPRRRIEAQPKLSRQAEGVEVEAASCLRSLNDAGIEVVSAFKAAARSLISPERIELRPTKRTKGKGDSGGDRYAASKLAADYVNLCQHPLKDLRRWIAEDRKNAGGAGRRLQPTTSKGENHAHDKTQTVLADAHGLRRQPLPQLRGGLDAHGQRGRGVDGVPARPRTSAGRYDGLRQVREEGRSAGLNRDHARGDALTRASSFEGERAVMRAFYGAKIEATRNSVPSREIAAAIRALLDEWSVSSRALVERQQARATAGHRDATQRRRKLEEPKSDK